MSIVRPGVSVLLVDDHAVVREGYRRLLERSGDDVRVVGEAANSADAYQAFLAVQPDVVVMDISLPGVSGIETLRRMIAREPRVRVLVFSMHEEAVFATRAFQAGAQGYVTKASAPEVLVEAVRAVAGGQRFLSQDMAQVLALQTLEGADSRLSVLSQREFEIVQMLVDGLTLTAIAGRLGLSYKTVANYQSAIRQKLGAETPAQLLRIAERSGILPGRT